MSAEPLESQDGMDCLGWQADVVGESAAELPIAEMACRAASPTKA